MTGTLYAENDFRSYKELYHHGILGQKWGRKQGPPYPLDAGDHSAAEKKAGWRRSLGDYTIKKGTKVKRLTTELNEDVGKERKYVTVKDKDSDAYANFYSHELSSSKNRPFVYQQEYYFNDKVRVAGRRSYEKAFNEVYKNHTEELGKFDKKQALKDFNKHLSDRNSDINKEFFDILSKKGYDAVQDLFSKEELQTKSSIIMLNPENSLRKGKTNIVLSNQTKNQENNAGGWYTKTSEQGNAIRKNVEALSKTIGAYGGYTLGLATLGTAGGWAGRSFGGDLGKSAGQSVLKMLGDRKISTIGNNSTVELNSYLAGLSDTKLSDLRSVNKGYDKDLDKLIEREQNSRK